MRSRDPARWSLIVASGLLLIGCQQMPPAVVDASTIPPPANLEPRNPAPTARLRPVAWGSGFDGHYSGEMFLSRNPGGRCDPRVPVTGMTVANNHVRFGRFGGGAIDPGGTVQMVEGNAWITGRFDGRQFIGDFVPPMPACAYRMVLNRAL